jgi:anti-sigma factor RsiW
VTTDPGPPDLPDVPCQALVELVTDYLDDALTPQRRAEVDAHLAICAGCREVLSQWRTIVRLGGHLATDDAERVDPAIRANLLAAFRARSG